MARRGSVNPSKMPPVGPSAPNIPLAQLCKEHMPASYPGLVEATSVPPVWKQPWKQSSATPAAQSHQTPPPTDTSNRSTATGGTGQPGTQTPPRRTNSVQERKMLPPSTPTGTDPRTGSSKLPASIQTNASSSLVSAIKHGSQSPAPDMNRQQLPGSASPKVPHGTPAFNNRALIHVPIAAPGKTVKPTPASKSGSPSYHTSVVPHSRAASTSSQSITPIQRSLSVEVTAPTQLEQHITSLQNDLQAQAVSTSYDGRVTSIITKRAIGFVFREGSFLRWRLPREVRSRQAHLSQDYHNGKQSLIKRLRLPCLAQVQLDGGTMVGPIKRSWCYKPVGMPLIALGVSAKRDHFATGQAYEVTIEASSELALQVLTSLASGTHRAETDNPVLGDGISTPASLWAKHSTSIGTVYTHVIQIPKEWTLLLSDRSYRIVVWTYQFDNKSQYALYL